jgi:hypothetical protein
MTIQELMNKIECQHSTNEWVMLFTKQLPINHSFNQLDVFKHKIILPIIKDDVDHQNLDIYLAISKFYNSIKDILEKEEFIISNKDIEDTYKIGYNAKIANSFITFEDYKEEMARKNTRGFYIFKENQTQVNKILMWASITAAIAALFSALFAVLTYYHGQ